VSDETPSDAPKPVATPVTDDAPDMEESEVVADPVAAMREERDRFREQLLRTAADFDNYRKRSRKDVEDAERRGKEDVIREVLPVLDNLERALGATASLAPDAGVAEVKAIVDGVKMVLKLFEDQAGRMGLTKVKAVGERFDPSLHDAIQQVETDEHPAGTVIQEIVAGYRLGEKLVRPAMVVVARKPAASA
jgi:molecular chaperone GrpE